MHIPSSALSTARTVSVCLAVAAILCGCATPHPETVPPGSPPPIESPPLAGSPVMRPSAGPASPRPDACRNPESLSDVFERVNPSVVVLMTEERKPSRERFGKEEVENSIGTGFVISKDGLIMTASHVIEVVDRVIVRFHDGWEEEAEVVAASSRADVALVRLKNVPDNLQVAQLGDSTQVRIGDQIFIVGSPYGIDFTLTTGHISGRRTQNVYSSEAIPIVQLQTDAAINQGNSGGPMFNMAGQVVGVVSYILTQSGGFEGIGFAVSINTAQEILLNQSAFWSGVEFYPVAGPLASALNIPQGTGLLVQRVAKNAPAQRLEIKPGTIPIKIGDEEFFIGGDIVIAINGIPSDPTNTEQMVEIRQSVNNMPPGGKIRVKVIRAGKIITLSTTK